MATGFRVINMSLHRQLVVAEEKGRGLHRGRDCVCDVGDCKDLSGSGSVAYLSDHHDYWVSHSDLVGDVIKRTHIEELGDRHQER